MRRKEIEKCLRGSFSISIIPNYLGPILPVVKP